MTGVLNVCEVVDNGGAADYDFVEEDTGDLEDQDDQEKATDDNEEEADNDDYDDYTDYDEDPKVG